MQKRHRQKPDSAILPLTTEDAVKADQRRNRRRRQRNGGRIFGVSIRCCMVLGLSLLALLWYLPWGKYHKPTVKEVLTNPIVKSFSSSMLPLSKFPSLKEALDNADIVALYFAASWCNQSTPVTEKLNEFFPPSNKNVYRPGGAKYRHSKAPLAIVYVSSDESEEEMKEYASTNWLAVPYDSKDRTDLKLHFRTCAKREMEKLGLEYRRHEIPSLIIIDSATNSLLTTEGIKDLKFSDDPLKQWEYLLTVAEDFQTEMHIPYN